MEIREKKSLQLGMNASTASNRLVKDTLFRLLKEAGHTCHKCGGDLERDSFSVEHKIPWLDSENPKELFFDQSNIAFSHLSCNIKGARKQQPSFTREQHREKHTVYMRSWRERKRR